MGSGEAFVVEEEEATDARDPRAQVVAAALPVRPLPPDLEQRIIPCALLHDLKPQAYLGVRLEDVELHRVRDYQLGLMRPSSALRGRERDSSCTPDLERQRYLLGPGPDAESNTLSPLESPLSIHRCQTFHSPALGRHRSTDGTRPDAVRGTLSKGGEARLGRQNPRQAPLRRWSGVSDQHGHCAPLPRQAEGS